MINTSKIASDLKTFFKDPAVYGQIAAQIPKAGIGMVSTELGNKLFNGAVGAIGNMLNEATVKREDLRSLFTNLMVSIADPTSNQLREIKRNASDLLAGLKSHNFSTTFGALLEEPHNIIGSIKQATRFGNFSLKGFKGFKGFKGASSASSSPIGFDKNIKEVSPKIVSVYGSRTLTEQDLMSY